MPKKKKKKYSTDITCIILGRKLKLLFEGVGKLRNFADIPAATVYCDFKRWSGNSYRGLKHGQECWNVLICSSGDYNSTERSCAGLKRLQK